MRASARDRRLSPLVAPMRGGTGKGSSVVFSRKPLRSLPPSRRARVRRRPWPAMALALAGVVAVLTCIGLVMVLSASSVHSLRTHGNSWYIFQRQVVWVLLGLAAFAVTSFVDYGAWRRMGPALLIVSLTLCGLLMTPLGVSRYGATRWIGPPGMLIQPSETLKLGLALSLANLLANRRYRMFDPRVTLRPWMVLSGISAGLVMLQPDMGTAMILVVLSLAVLVAAGMDSRTLFKLFVGLTAFAVILAWAEPYRRARILGFLHPESEAGYHLRQSLVGLVSGRWVGVGVGASRAKWGFLPNAHTDFIFAVIGEELGLVGCALVASLFLGFTWFGLQAARRAPDRFGLLAAAGITTWIVAQAVVNMGAVIGILPITGVPLPLISVGGSSMVVVMASIGIVLNVARHGVVAIDLSIPAGAPAFQHPPSSTAIGEVAGSRADSVGVGRHPASASSASSAPTPQAAPGAKPPTIAKSAASGAVVLTLHRARERPAAARVGDGATRPHPRPGPRPHRPQ